MVLDSTYDPQDFLKSSLRSIVSAIESVTPFDSVLSQPVYDVIESFPPPDVLKSMPLDRTLIHLEVDDINSMRIGFGDGILAEAYDDDPVFPAPLGLIQPYESACYEINFDVGIWASAQSGGTTARLNAWSLLHSLFRPGVARTRFAEMTGGIQIRSWSGGRNVEETVNDIDLFRMVGATLVVRVFSTETALSEVEVVEIEQGSRKIDVNGVVVIDT